MDADAVYLVARILSCGVWTGAGIYKAFHYSQTVEEMTHLGVPLARFALVPVLILELVGSLMLVFNIQVWAVALVWIAFVIVATPFYHFKWRTPTGQFVFPQMVQTTKNLCIIGGLLLLILADPHKPAWLIHGLKGTLP